MQRSFNSSMTSMTFHLRAWLGLTLVLLLSAFTLAPPGPGSVKAYEEAPAATGVAFLQSSGTLVVSGQGFTPGGRIQIVIVDHQENALHAPVWTSAASTGFIAGHPGSEPAGSFVLVMRLAGVESTAIYGPNGSQDPANGYQSGINVSGLLDAGSIVVRAHDESANVWSTVAIVDANATLATQPEQNDQSEAAPSCASSQLCGNPY